MKLLIVVAFLVFAACTGLSPEQQSNMMTYLNGELASGRITQEQYNLLLAAFQETGPDWPFILTVLGSSALTAIGAIFGVDLRRGPPTKLENTQKALAAKVTGVEA